MYKQLLHQFLRLLFVIGVGLFIYLALTFSILYLYPFIIAFLLALMINPLVSNVEKYFKMPRALATFIVICLLFILLLGSIVIIVSELIQGTTYLAEKVPLHFQTFIGFIEEFIDTKILPYYHKTTSFIHSLDMSQQTAINDYIHSLSAQVASVGGTVLQNILLKIPMILSFLPQSITIMIFIIIATFLITNDMNGLIKVTKKITPVPASTVGKKVLYHFKKSFLGFLKAQFILITISFCLLNLGLILLQVDHALTISLLAALIDLLPYIGIGTIFIPWIIYLFIIGNYSLTIGLSVLYMIITIIRQIIEPKILSVNIGLNPLAALITLFISIQLWGILGLLLAPLLLILTNAVYQSGIIKQLWYFVKG